MARVNVIATFDSNIMADVAKGTGKAIPAALKGISKDLDRFSHNRRRTLDPLMEGVVRSAKDKALDYQKQSRVRPNDPYRAGEGRLPGHLAKALTGPGLARVNGGKIQFGDTDKLFSDAEHLLRLNYGTRGGTPGPGVVNVRGQSFAVPQGLFRSRNKHHKNIIKQGFFSSSGGRYYPGPITNARDHGETGKLSRVRNKVSDVEGQFFLSRAGVYTQAAYIETFTKYIEDLTEKSIKTSVQEFRTYKYTVV